MDKPLPKTESQYLVGHFEHGDFWAGHETYNIEYAYNWIEEKKRKYPKRKVEWVIVKKLTTYQIIDDEI